MAGGISIHVVDVTRGVPAAGMRVEVFALTPERRSIAAGVLGAGGTLDHAIVRGDGVAAGRYEIVIEVGAWYRAQGVALPEPAFLEDLPFRFGIADAVQHFHLPVKLSPWGVSLWRGA
jgi:5-hydroxyisourate hydrolase